MGENSSFIFTVCVRPVPLYHFKLAYVVLHIVVKECFDTHFKEWRNSLFKSLFTDRVVLADLEI